MSAHRKFQFKVWTEDAYDEDASQKRYDSFKQLYLLFTYHLPGDAVGRNTSKQSTSCSI